MTIISRGLSNGGFFSPSLHRAAIFIIGRRGRRGVPIALTKFISTFKGLREWLWRTNSPNKTRFPRDSCSSINLTNNASISGLDGCAGVREIADTSSKPRHANYSQIIGQSINGLWSIIGNDCCVERRRYSVLNKSRDMPLSPRRESGGHRKVIRVNLGFGGKNVDGIPPFAFPD